MSFKLPSQENIYVLIADFVIQHMLKTQSQTLIFFSIHKINAQI